ncbi:MAG: energy transducer TonB, partial [Minicystis sp.]
ILDAASTWRFSPATCQGKPVAVKSELGFALLPPPPRAPPIAPSIPPAAQTAFQEGTSTLGRAPSDQCPTGKASSKSAFIPFGPGMNRPTLVSGRQPVYSQKAREAGVEGKVIACCVLTTDGLLRNCRIGLSIPLLDQSVLDALATQRYTPITFQGQPVNVAYTLTFNFRLN